MTDFSNKYGNRAKNLWRKVYGYRNYQPSETTIVEADTGVTYSIDLNKTIRHRDYFIIDGYVGPLIASQGGTSSSPYPTAEYDEGLFYITEESSFNQVYFSFMFSSTPIVVLTVESASRGGTNLQLYGKTTLTDQFFFETSAPFSGTIRYRAIYSPTYPALATTAYTTSITASAGTTNGGGATYYTASYSALPGTPFKFLQSGWDNSYPAQTLGPDIWFTTETSSSTAATVHFSSEMNADIHFIAFYS